MRKNATSNLKFKEQVFQYIITPLVFISIFIFFYKRADKQSLIICNEEKSLYFEGVLNHYKTDISAGKSSFTLNDTVLITIPRTSKEMYLNDGDTIQKLEGTNTYTVKRGMRFIGQKNNGVDTFQFSCPN